MHFYHQQTQSDECLICFAPLLKDMSFAHMLKPIPICQKCLKQFEIIDTVIDFHHYPLRILYYYNDFFKTLLFQYKGLYDHALKDVFLCLYLSELKQRYKNYIIVVAPSSSEDNQVRGFAPIENIASSFSSSIFTGLYKKEKYKQSDLSYQERKRVYEKIGINNGEVLKGKQVLILDDVVTSGATLCSCLTLILQQKPALVEVLVLSTKKSIEDLYFGKKVTSLL